MNVCERELIFTALQVGDVGMSTIARAGLLRRLVARGMQCFTDNGKTIITQFKGNSLKHIKHFKAEKTCVCCVIIEGLKEVVNYCLELEEVDVSGCSLVSECSLQALLTTLLSRKEERDAPPLNITLGGMSYSVAVVSAMQSVTW